MRNPALFLLGIILLAPDASADITVNIQNDFGYTAVDVSEAMGIPHIGMAPRRRTMPSTASG